MSAYGKAEAVQAAQEAQAAGFTVTRLIGGVQGSAAAGTAVIGGIIGGLFGQPAAGAQLGGALGGAVFRGAAPAGVVLGPRAQGFGGESLGLGGPGPPMPLALQGGGRMSLLGNGGISFGGVLERLPAIIGAVGALRRPAAPATFTQAAFPAALPMLGGLGARLAPMIGGAGAAVGVAVARGRAIVSSAVSYCKANPGWCASIGGLAAVEALVRGGQLPLKRRRRARGISGRDLRAFSRVHRVLSKFCAGPARGRVRGKPRR